MKLTVLAKEIERTADSARQYDNSTLTLTYLLGYITALRWVWDQETRS